MIGLALARADAEVVLLALDAHNEWATPDEATRANAIAVAIRTELQENP